MTLMPSWRRALLTLAAATVGVGAAAVPASAQEPAALGWWWVGRPTAMFPAMFAPAPAPPEGGLYVAGGVGGPSGMSALRFEADPASIATTLTLTIAEASGTPVINACPPAEPWEPAENGGWDQRPEPDCETASVTGALNGDKTEVSFSLFSLQGDSGVIDVVLSPGEDPETESPANFSVTFEAPAADAVAVTEPADTGISGAAEPAAAAPPTAAAPSTESFSAPGAPPPPLTETAAPPEPQPSAQSSAAAGQPTLSSGSGATEGFAYPAVLALPLVLLMAGSYLGWSLTRPVAIRGRAS